MAEPQANYPVTFNVKYPESSSRVLLLVRLFFGGMYVGIPHMFCLFFYAIGAMFVSFIAWWAILFTGKYPRGMFEYNLGLTRWMLRVSAYMQSMTDIYPPFNGKP